VTVVSTGTTISWYEVVGVAVGIRVAPDVLLPVDLDVQRPAVGRQALGRPAGDEDPVGELGAVGAGVRRIADGAELGEGDHREHDEDDRGAERPGDLEAGVAADLGGDGPLAGPELEERVEQRALDPEEHHDRDGQDELVEGVDLIGVRGPSRFRRDRVGEGAAGEGEQQAERGKGGQDHEAGVSAGRLQSGRDSIH
jgi:hypothetical protein